MEVMNVTMNDSELQQPGQDVPNPAAGAPHNVPVLLCAIAFFFLAFCMNAGLVKGIALVGGLAAVVSVCIKHRTVAGRLSIPALFLILYVGMDAASTLHTVSRNQALYEFLTVWCAFCFFLLVLAFAKGQGRSLGRGVGFLLELCAALTSLFSIDLISTRTLSSAFLGLMSLIEPAYGTMTGIEAGVRMTSVIGNPNIYAGCAGIGVLIALGLATTAPAGRDRYIHLTCLALNALGFVLAFSMGATAFLAAAFLVYLLLERKERRGGLLVCMVETLVVTLAATFPIYLTAFHDWSGIQPVPLCAAILAAVALCLLDKLAGRRAADFLAPRGGMTLALLLALLAAAALYLALALNVTGSASLAAGETLRRSAYPAGGDYTLTLDSTAPLTVTVESQNRQETMMHTSTPLYEGPVKDASFTVPEDSTVVYLTFQAEEDTTLTSAALIGSDGTYALKLGYKLLPGFMANRLQGLFANENAIQRTVFFQDGLKLFARSPVIGLGMGAFENSYTSVQDFAYTTRYVHNHYIQTMLETGVVGLVLFAGLLLTSAAAVLLARRREDAHPLTPCLGGALVFMAGHAAVEVVFSSNLYLPMAFGVFALLDLCCGGTLPLCAKKENVRLGVTVGTAVCTGLYTILLLGNVVAAAFASTPSYESYAAAAALDPFEKSDYMLAYVQNAFSPNNNRVSVRQKAEKYAARLEKLESRSIPLYLAGCYLSDGQTDKAFQLLERFADFAPMNSDTWKTALSWIAANADGADGTYPAHAATFLKKFEAQQAVTPGGLTADQSVIDSAAAVAQG